ncbi:2'-5' RNA ligase family protein [Nonomuraea antimicrobica]|uniref:2'-5' RNA ligase family protein n=1 Tax=Nonomuraea antimicrobica TaxID=561173 RepID=UPI003CD09ED2
MPADRPPVVDLYVLGTFPRNEGTLFLTATVTADLLACHARVHTALADEAVEHWSHYLPGNWVPHCTLALGLDSVGRTTAIGLLHDYQPVTATITATGITDTRRPSSIVLQHPSRTKMVGRVHCHLRKTEDSRSSPRQNSA